MVNKQNKQHCFNYISNLLTHLNEKELNDVKSMLKKLEGDKQGTSEFLTQYKTEAEREAKKQLYENIKDFEKTELAINKIDALQKDIYKKNIIGQESKRDFKSAFKAFVYESGASDLMYKKITNTNQALNNFAKKLRSIDDDAVNLLFGDTVKQKWENLKFLGEKTKTQSAVQKLSEDIMRESYQLSLKDTEKAKIGITKNKTALEFAKVMKEEIDPLLKHLDIDTLDGHMMIQGHDVDKIKKLTPREFANTLIDDFGLDIGRMFNSKIMPDSIQLKNGKFVSASVVDKKGIITEINRSDLEAKLFWIKDEIQNGTIKENIFISNDAEKRRFIHFKDPETQIRYNREFNKGENIIVQARNTIAKLNDQKSIYDNLGSNPYKTINDIIYNERQKVISGEGANDVPFKVNGNRIEISGEDKVFNKAHVGDFLISYLTPSRIGYESNKLWATTLRAGRAITNLALLPKIAVSYLSDTHTFLFSQAIQGKNLSTAETVGMFLNKFGKDLYGVLHAPFTITPLFEKTRNNLAKEVEALGLASHRMSSNINRYIEEQMTGLSFIDGLQNMLFSSTDVLDNKLKKYARDIISGNMIQESKITWNNLSDARKVFYSKYDIGEKEFNLMKKHLIRDRGNNEGFDIFPELIDNISDDEIKKFARQDIFNKGKVSDRTISLARNELKEKFNVLFTKEIDKMQGQDKTMSRVAFLRNTKSGTLEGELRNGFSQLQSWSYNFTHNNITAIFNHPTYTSFEKVGKFASLMTIGAVGAYLYKNVFAQITQGKTPKPLWNDGDSALDIAKNIVSLYEYSNAFTYYGDLLLRAIGASSKLSEYSKSKARRDRIIEGLLGPSMGGGITGAISLYEHRNKINQDYIINTLTRNAPNISILQPMMLAFMNMNFWLSDAKVSDINDKLYLKGQKYFIPTK